MQTRELGWKNNINKGLSSH